MFGHTARMSFIVWSTPFPHVDPEVYHRWYNEVHLPDAIENGSFTAMHRYQAVGPGHKAGPFLSIAEADYGSEDEAWASVYPKAQALRQAGRVDDLYRVDFATMLLTVHTEVSQHPVQTLTTVQNDWRIPDTSSRGPKGWLRTLDIPSPQGARSLQLFTTPVIGKRGPGLHLALYESATDLATTVKAWATAGSPGITPFPPYTTLYGVTAPPLENEPGPSPVWVMHWRHLVTVGR